LRIPVNFAPCQLSDKTHVLYSEPDISIHTRPQKERDFISEQYSS